LVWSGARLAHKADAAGDQPKRDENKKTSFVIQRDWFGKR